MKTIIIKYAFFLLGVMYSGMLSAQPIFSYGNNEVSKAEFVRAFTKNNTGQHITEKAVRDYLELFIRFKLKVQEAYVKKLDTLPNQKAELLDFRRQMVENAVNNNDGLQRLVKEAFNRSQLEIRLSHIFVPLTTGAAAVGKTTASPDQSKSLARATGAYNELKKGAEFGRVASLYSADPAVRNNKGDIGFVTVFTLPYALENIAYGLPEGGVSKPWLGSTGYHIFKNTGIRKNPGIMRARQMLVSFPPGTNNEGKNALQQKADSIYHAMAAGLPFEQAVARFGGTDITSGELPAFGVGNYEAAFEQAVFALQHDGDVTKPVLTALGYHIVQRIKLTPVNADSSDLPAMEALKQQVLNDARIKVAEKEMLSKIYQAMPLKNAKGNAKEMEKLKDGSLTKYQDSVAFAYYRDHLEDFDPEFAAQVKEFKEGNVLFEIMQRTIWDKASADSVEMKQYYEQHKAAYWWLPGADAIIFTCPDSLTAGTLRSQLKGNAANWRGLTAGNDKVQADSGRFEFAQLMIQPPAAAVAGLITEPVKAGADNSNVSFAYIIRIYPEKALRSFEDAKGFVLNDYQGMMEEKWINALKLKYPVKIHEDVLQTLWKP